MIARTIKIILISSIFTSCATQNSFKTMKDIEDIETLSKLQALEFITENSPKYLEGSVCDNTFQREKENENLTKLELVSCLSHFVKDVGIKDIDNPYDDIERNSSLGSIAYFFNAYNILSAKGPYTFGSNDKISGKELINAYERIKKLKDIRIK